MNKIRLWSQKTNSAWLYDNLISKLTFLMIQFILLCSALFSLNGQNALQGGMISPDIDEPGKPFSYFWKPTDVIGALYAPVATEVTPEGHLYTGFGEFEWFVGNPLEPVDVRIKTLHKGYLPIIQYDLLYNGVRYYFTMFGVDLGGALEGLPVNFVEVRMVNEMNEPRAAFISSAYRYSAPNNRGGSIAEYRFSQRFDLIPSKYTDGQIAYNKDWTYSIEDGTLKRDGRILYFYPESPEPFQVSKTPMNSGVSGYRYFTGEITGTGIRKISHDKYTPMGIVMHRLILEPSASETIVYKIPIVPVPENSQEADQIRQADYEDHFHETVSIWEELVGNNPALKFPEAKVQEALLANTVFNLLAIDKVGDDYIQNINKFQYHTFFGGSDPSHMRIGYDYMGLLDIAHKTVLYTMTNQAPDGSFPIGSRAAFTDDPRIDENFGWNLWCVGRHYELTRDADFLRQVYPGVVKAMEWGMNKTSKDSLGLFPAYYGLMDDAGVDGVRQMSAPIWALHGIIHAINMAEAMGEKNDVTRFKAEFNRLRKAFDKQIEIMTSMTGGWIPPSLEKTIKGNHWDNLMLLYPEPLFDPFDPKVTATIKKSREAYSEGILGYVHPRAIAKKGDQYIFNETPGLHYWHTQDNGFSSLARGSTEDQQYAVKDLYAQLLHTTSTHGPQEFSTVPWSTRDYISGDIIPDGPASGKLIEFMRNMLVREFKDNLYLFSALSPAWLQPGKLIEVNNGPTSFGPVSASMAASIDKWEVKISNQFWENPDNIIIRIPWFLHVQKVEADGKIVQINNKNEIVLSPSVHSVSIFGKFKPGSSQISFDSTVIDYQKEFKRRYEEFLRTGEINPYDNSGTSSTVNY